VGAVLGFVAGLGHLILLLGRHDDARQDKPPRDKT
jgi:hypothetical protein